MTSPRGHSIILTRRGLLTTIALGIADASLAACGGTSTATPVPPPSDATRTATNPAPAIGGTSSREPTTAIVASTAALTRTPAVVSTTAITGNAATAPAASGSISPPRNEQEVTFTSGADTLYGSLLLPPDGGQGRKFPAAVILAGSGPTDRDGNTKLIPGPINTLRDFADILAGQGVASLRYDKVGSGKTSLASHTNPTDIGFALYVDAAQAAQAVLRARPEIDSGRVIFLGHSEGGLIALVIADKLKGMPTAPKALVLAAPPGFAYLETIQRQITDQYMQAVKAGQVTKDQADTALAEQDRAIVSIKQTGKVPTDLTTPALKQIFTPVNEKFLAEVETYDPRQIAAGLPPTLPVLVLHGAKDQQVNTADVQNLMQGFQTAGNTKATLAELPNVDHMFKEVPGTPNPSTDYGNPALRFSVDASAQVGVFMKANV